ncbi:MAG: OB-fold domain-containing protein [Deltaproteobacteria bacterium]|nr:OB-fold domain-containing protein [Deltaproteobacteria bacterium]
MTEYTKPLPVMEGLAREFYDWCKKEDLHFQKCTSCDTFRHVPREMCAECNSFEWEWARSTGRGTVYTWVVVNRALHPAFSRDAPYADVVVEMEEGVRLLSTVVDCPPEELEIGMPVQLTYDPVAEDITLPRFKRRS